MECQELGFPIVSTQAAAR